MLLGAACGGENGRDKRGRQEEKGRMKGFEFDFKLDPSKRCITCSF